MNAFYWGDANEWQRTLGRTQEYLHNRVFGKGCDRSLIEAWRRFYHTHDPIVRAMVARAGLTGKHAGACAEVVWLGILIDVPKLPTPLPRDAFLYWLSQLVRAKAAEQTSPDDGDATTGANGNGEAEGFPEFPLPASRPRQGSSGSPTEGDDYLADPAVQDAAALHSRLFELRFVEERSLEDVAAALGMAVGQITRRERRMLRSILSILINLDTGCTMAEPAAIGSRSA